MSQVSEQLAKVHTPCECGLPEQVVPQAEAAVKSARAELYAVARKLHGELWPKEPQPAATGTSASSTAATGSGERRSLGIAQLYPPRAPPPAPLWPQKH